MASTSGNILVALPLEQRKQALRYANEEGTLGATAYPINYDEVYNLKGRLLTIIDATFPDPEQRKAQKDIVWGELKRWMDDIVRDGEWRDESAPSATGCAGQIPAVA
jgi:hypothetical protein